MNGLFKYLKGDRTIWMVCLILGLTSILAVYSSISSLAYKYTGGNTLYYLFKHALMLGTGFLIMYFVHKVPYKYFARIAQMGIWLTAGLLLLTLLMGENINDASRWIKIPIINQNFQTSDLAKIVLITYVARMLTVKKDILGDLKEGFLPIIGPILLICGLILPANFSTAAMLFMVCMLLLFIGGMPFKYLIGTVGTGVAAFVFLIVLSSSFPGLLPRAETWKARIVNFESGDSDANYQKEHAMMAIQSGGLLPGGPGSGDSRNYLPHPYSDMIYAFIIEEYGTILGGAGILLLYIIFIYRCVKVARHTQKDFPALLVVGLSFLIGIQALINMGVAVSIFPVTGQPLPLVSMGGTSMWFTCIAMGMIISVSRTVTEGEPKPVTKKGKNYAVA